MPYSLLYVSKTLVPPADCAAELASIVALSRVYNAMNGISGALLSTGTYFVQVLEGSQEAVEALMERIYADPRHMRVKTIRVAQEERRFAAWSLAYESSETFVDRHIAPFFSTMAGGASAHLATRLLELMEKLARMPAG